MPRTIRDWIELASLVCDLVKKLPLTVLTIVLLLEWYHTGSLRPLYCALAAQALLVRQ